MKKFIYTTLLFVLSFAVMGCPSVKAEEALTISSWNVDASILETGDLTIVEDITFEFNDQYNGVFREIILEKTSGIADLHVKEILQNEDLEYSEANDADNGDQGVFVVEESSDDVLIKIFSPSENEEKTFRISYIVKNVAIRYNDIGELYYKFLGSENETPIDNFTVNIQLPKSISEDSKIFAHGPLNGEMGKKAVDTFFLRVNNVNSNTFVEARVLFPSEYISLSTNRADINNYENILEEEADFQKKIEEDLQKKETIGKLLEQTSIIAVILGFGLFVILIFSFRRRNKSNETEEYSRIPEDCTPAIAASLTSIPIDSNTIIATILDLFRKGYLRVDYERESNSKKSDEKAVIISKVKEDINSLSNHEKHFIKWLIDDMGNEKSVSTQDMEDYSKENSTEFLESFNEWKKKIKEDTNAKGYYDKTKGKYATGLVLSSTLFLILGIFTLVYGSIIGVAVILVSVLLFIYAMTLYYRRSDYGYEQYVKWIGFKKYIKEFRNHSSIDDFSKYPHDNSIIYALGLGVDMKIANKFEFNRDNGTDQIHTNNSWIYWYFILNSGSDNAFNRSINNSFGDTGGASTGGFSGGGGGGAGGGGAGGF
ncbi:DUF2207 domain-containing protein [Alkalibaculum sp. M08DMB]|uniref:DUF2207 domain-containing protein n=1 Tax=Alkalibaculum sporogenes TaxID=2655001 RepID=A0A6A7K4G3_9FIRM|nr:DUF2207 domain-containing protein [Alkalibaculum sporogenes]MPW24339.1 DUF2207 domain-containing protein [Alkalibaculum sporogenes]